MGRKYLRILGERVRIGYKKGRKKEVEDEVKKVRKQVESILRCEGRAAAIQHLEKAKTKLMRSGGRGPRGSNLTRAIHRRGGKTRGKVIEKGKASQVK